MSVGVTVLTVDLPYSGAGSGGLHFLYGRYPIHSIYLQIGYY